MSTVELKRNLIQKITELTNPSIIEEIQRLIDFDSDTGEMTLTSDQITRIEEARAEYQSGYTLPEADADNEIEKWLKK